jgi:hypothetical protein
MQASDRYPAALLAAFSAVWLGLAIDPSYRQDWLLENVIDGTSCVKVRMTREFVVKREEEVFKVPKYEELETLSAKLQKQLESKSVMGV